MHPCVASRTKLFELLACSPSSERLQSHAAELPGRTAIVCFCVLACFRPSSERLQSHAAELPGRTAIGRATIALHLRTLACLRC
eukprot:1083023-Alexandrium_andersonii.AAC.1